LVLFLWVERNQEQSCFYYLFYGLQKLSLYMYKNDEDEDEDEDFFIFFTCS
jgi:hypothetical protein